MSVFASINCAMTRTRFAAPCTLPSTTCATPSSFAIWRRLRFPSLLYCITDVRLITFKSAIFARLLRISSCTASAKNAFSGSALRFSKGSTAIPAGSGRDDSLSQNIAPTTAARATNDAIKTVLVGLRRTHFRPRVKTPTRRARIGSCRSQRSRSSASASADW